MLGRILVDQDGRRFMAVPPPPASLRRAGSERSFRSYDDDRLPYARSKSGGGGSSVDRYGRPLERAGSFGYSVRVLPHAEALPSDADLALLTTA